MPTGTKLFSRGFAFVDTLRTDEGGQIFTIVYLFAMKTIVSHNRRAKVLSEIGHLSFFEG